MTSEISNPIIWMQNNRDTLVKLIQDLVRIPSVSGKEKDVQQFIYEKFKELDLDPKFINPDINVLQDNEDYFATTSFEKFGYDNRPNVAGIMKGSGMGRSICLSGHIDVVSPEPIKQWTHDPWGGDIEGDFIYGRGAGDMKAGVAAVIFAVQAFKKTQTKLKGDVFIETTIEEEDGGIGGNLYLRITQSKTKAKADAAIIPEPGGYGISLASAGVMYFKVIVLGIPAHAATAHYGENAIL
ncbi:MAG: M20 family metallopeptidase, partial [Promethearchaeota archaeon]